MELENKVAIPVEIDCSDCHHKAQFAVRLSNSGGKYDVYICEHCGKEIRVPVSGDS